jgi:hypothetical protein
LKETSKGPQVICGTSIAVVTNGEVPIVSHEDVHSAYFLNELRNMRKKYRYTREDKLKPVNTAMLSSSMHEIREVDGVFSVFASQEGTVL